MTLALVGCLVGLLTGLSGTGGSALLTPLLVLVFGLPPTAAVSNDLVVTAVLKLAGSAVHTARREVHRGLVLWLSCGGVPGALVGPMVVRFCGPSPLLQSLLRISLGVVLLGVALATAWTAGRHSRGLLPPAQVPVRRGRTVLLGAVTGLLVGFTSVGSGSIVAAALLLGYPLLRPSALVATDVVQALPMVVTAALGHLLLGGLHVDVVWPLLLGGVPGVLLGAYLTPRLPARGLRAVLLVLLATTGIAMLTSSAAALIAVFVGASGLAVAGTRRRARDPLLATN